MKENYFNKIKGITTYEKIKSFADDEQLGMIDKQYKQGRLYFYGVDDVKKIDKEKNIVVFLENRCTDAATLMPFLDKIAYINNNIKLHFCSANENEELLVETFGEKKIPTVVALNSEMEVSGVYREFPIKVKKLIERNPEKKEMIVKGEFRKGKYNLDIQKDIIELLLTV